MKLALTVFSDPDSYELLIEGNFITRITKFLSCSNLSREVTWEQLDEKTKQDIKDALHEHFN